MKLTTMLMAAGAIVAAPAVVLAAPTTGPTMAGPTMTGHMMTAPHIPSPTTAPGNGQYNGSGYNHMNSGMAKGQPNQSCQTINGGNTGPDYPGNTSTAPGSAFNETNGNAGPRYAGSQLQNARNTASVSQYDVACANQPH